MLRSARLFAPLLLAAAALPALAGTVAFDTTGGDAWTFAKTLTGSAEGCAAVTLRSPAGSVPATLVDGRFAARVPLHGGDNAVAALCDGAVAAGQRWSVRLDDRPVARIRLRAGDAVTLDAGASRAAPGRGAPILRRDWRAAAGNPAPLPTADGRPLDGAAGETVTLRPPAVDGDYGVVLRTTDALGRADEAKLLLRAENGALRAAERPAWIDDAVVYGVAPHFFGPRGLADVAARLDDIAALGATVLWLSPITAAPDDDFGYAVTDHFAVRESFGGDADLKALVAGAHARGIKVIMDFVPNHLSDAHPYHVDAEARGAASPYHGWFDRGGDGAVTSYFGWDNLKNLDFDEAEVRAMMTAAFRHWVEEFDVDGFRIDVSWGVHERAPEFWPGLVAELKRIKPDLLLLSESTIREDWPAAAGFDAAYDWTEKLGHWAWTDVFAPEGPDLDRLRAALAATEDAEALVFRFLNNNDTGARFVTRFGPDQTRLAATLLMTLPGLPLVYNGDEAGAEFEPYQQEEAIDWTDRHGLRAHYARLIALRRAEPALHGRGLRMLATEADERVLAYVRPGATPAGDVLVAINFGAAATVRLPTAGGIDLLTGASVRAEGGRVALPARGAVVLRAAVAPASERVKK